MPIFQQSGAPVLAAEKAQNIQHIKHKFLKLLSPLSLVHADRLEIAM